MSEFASTVAILGSIASQLMNLSAIPSIYEIHVARSTLAYPFFPFLISLVASVSGLCYAFMTAQLIVAMSTMFSLMQNLVYLSVHFRYSQQRSSIINMFSTLIILEALVLVAGPAAVCAASRSGCLDFSVMWVGIVCTLVYCVVYCGQLTTFKEIIRTKNSASISPHLTAGTFICALIWTWYSILVKDQFYLASSLVGDVSAFTQVFLLLRYPRIVPLANTEIAEIIGVKSLSQESLKIIPNPKEVSEMNQDKEQQF